MTAQIEAKFVGELPVVVKPMGLYIAVAWYYGPGSIGVTGHWKIFRQQFATVEAAEEFLAELSEGYTQRRIYHLQ